MTERVLFSREEIKELALAYESLTEELEYPYYNRDDKLVDSLKRDIDALLVKWGVWSDDYGWVSADD